VDHLDALGGKLIMLDDLLFAAMGIGNDAACSLWRERASFQAKKGPM